MQALFSIYVNTVIETFTQKLLGARNFFKSPVSIMTQTIHADLQFKNNS